MNTCRQKRSRKAEEEWESEREDLLFFRSQTIAIVRHFFEIASQIGRMPSIMGREFFRAKVSHHAIPSFEEQAIFVHDVERALNRLEGDAGDMVALVGLFHFTLADVAAMRGRSVTWAGVHYRSAVDQLAEIFLEIGLLRDDRPDRYIERFPGKRRRQPEVGWPPKKPTASVAPETYHIVGVESHGMSVVMMPQRA
jgi:hypothetical protein